MFSKKCINRSSVFFSFFLVASVFSTVMAKGRKSSRKKKKKSKNRVENSGVSIFSFGFLSIASCCLGFLAHYKYSGYGSVAKKVTGAVKNATSDNDVLLIDKNSGHKRERTKTSILKNFHGRTKSERKNKIHDNLPKSNINFEANLSTSADGDVGGQSNVVDQNSHTHSRDSIKKKANHPRRNFSSTLDYSGIL